MDVGPMEARCQKRSSAIDFLLWCSNYLHAHEAALSTDFVQAAGERASKRYGATEFGAVFRHMFSKYLHDHEATVRAHDEQIYFRTGDIARREGGYFCIVAQASFDIIKSGGYIISALDIERELLGLPYIFEVMVVSVADEEFGQRIAALVSLQEEDLTDDFPEAPKNSEQEVTIEDVRRDLRDRWAGYKLPTLLRVVSGGLPETVTGKAQKKFFGPKFFPSDYQTRSEVHQWVTPVRQFAKL
ncbi:acetyl-CoA synthetase-like protein [Plenodomus tracheiphilus IPT5]|uniref:Acetyl-CoA synthetase-like protein n=1 Tax=Plenodomus tracheiphilus IPT5 TaxID=1408161 RepID=A0A6A7B2Z4_9PLEO|nr:acetyl-CoA synthetase-like protein [Plenodomus tracheiphilus IPT5]